MTATTDETWTADGVLLNTYAWNIRTLSERSGLPPTRGENDAIARFSVLATGGSGGLLPESGQVYQVETGWRLIDGEWMLINASWTPNL